VVANERGERGAGRVLRIFADVRPGEAQRALLLTAATFVLLTAYYLLKTLREPLILLGQVGRFGGAELKAYATALQAVILLAVVPAYGRLASRVPRQRLIGATVVTLAACLVLFWALGHAGLPVGVPYYLWLGVASLIVVAQFWSLANDLYSPEEGERLFPLIAVGGALGAIAGARLSAWLLAAIGIFESMLVAGVLLGLYLWVCRAAERLPDGRRAPAAADSEPRAAVLGPEGGFTLVRKTRYLAAVAGMVVCSSFVNTQGEYLLGATVRAHAEAAVPEPAGAVDGPSRAEVKKARGVVIARYYGRFYTGVNVAAFLLQAFVVARVLGRLGVRGAVFVLPLVSLGSYSLIAAAPVLAVVGLAKAAENSTDYSLQNTIRHALFLPTSREAKYKAKAAIDSFFVRLGDVVAGGAVFVGLHALRLSVRGFAIANLVVVGGWLALAVLTASDHRRLTGARASDPRPDPPRARSPACDDLGVV
jgi:AAA family ATP:ADP antiporter